MCIKHAIHTYSCLMHIIKVWEKSLVITAVAVIRHVSAEPRFKLVAPSLLYLSIWKADVLPLHPLQLEANLGITLFKSILISNKCNFVWEGWFVWRQWARTVISYWLVIFVVGYRVGGMVWKCVWAEREGVGGRVCGKDGGGGKHQIVCQ